MAAMLRPLLMGLLAVTASVLFAAEPEAAASKPAAEEKTAVAAETAAPATVAKKQVVVIPVRDEIAKPVLYILRRGLKEAIEQKADVVVLDMKTPGGALDVTFDIMEALAKFPGETITFVNNEAISAGAYISAVTDEIYFAPDGVIGAAAPVTSTGQDVDKTMRLKIVSYLKARVRAISEGKAYRGQVISAMIDEDYELKIGEAVIKAKGELLSLTASEASKTYGDPAQPLLAAGTAKDLDALLMAKFGKDGYAVKKLEITWSERLAVLLNAITPVLLGLGLLALFIEFKTPGFGIFGIAGIVFLGVVFLSNFVAGFSGHEPMLVFALGLILLTVEIFFFPGIAVMAVSGLALMLGALVWSMADLWPNEPFTFSGELLVRPLTNVGIGMALALVMGAALLRYLPRGWVWDKLVLNEAVTANSQTGSDVTAEGATGGLIGREGVAVTALRPGGQVEIDGRRYEARVEIGVIEIGTPIVVVQRTGFELVVKKAGA